MIVKFETAKLAKEKGFGENVSWYYMPDAFHKEGIPRPIADGAIDPNETYYDGIHRDNSLSIWKPNSHKSNAYFSAPAQSQLQTWLRDKGILVNADFLPDNSKNKVFFPLVKTLEKESFGKVLLNEFLLHEDYESALEEGLFEALKLL